jgi:protocadherin-16/23
VNHQPQICSSTRAASITSFCFDFENVPGDESDGLDAFTIDEITGIVRTKAVLDHEQRAFYRMSVSARDQGRPPKETIRQLQIEVLDLNDNRPTFSTSSLTFKVGHLTVIYQSIVSAVL